MQFYIGYINEHTIPTILIPAKKEAVIDFINNKSPLEDAIAKAISTLNGAAFVKLSSRSPKDAYYPLNKEFSEDWSKWGILPSEDPEKIFMRVNAPWQVKALLGKSSRILQDLESFEEFQIVVRKWVVLKDEFKVFIFDNKVTAVCSYPTTRQDKKSLEILFRSEEFMSIMSTVPYRQAVVDIAFSDTGKVYIVEVNPFGKMSSAALFSWVEDKAILYGDEYNVKGTVIRLKYTTE